MCLLNCRAWAMIVWVQSLWVGKGDPGPGGSRAMEQGGDALQWWWWGMLSDYDAFDAAIWEEDSWQSSQSSWVMMYNLQVIAISKCPPLMWVQGCKGTVIVNCHHLYMRNIVTMVIMTICRADHWPGGYRGGCACGLQGQCFNRFHHNNHHHH